MNDPKLTTLTCKRCSVQFDVKTARLRNQERFHNPRQFCGRPCAYAARREETAERHAATPLPTFSCAHCGNVAPRKKTPGGRINLRPRFCGRDCASLAGKNNPGLPRHRRDRNGYIEAFTGGRDGKYIPEHRLVMERLMGRPLTKHETVHHRNGQRADNRPENLELWSSRHGKGQRVSDKIEFSAEFLREYGLDPQVPTVSEYISGIAGFV